MMREIETLDDLLKLTDKTLKITTIKDPSNFYTTLQEVCYNDKYVYFGIIYEGYPTWIRNNDSSKMTIDSNGDFNEPKYNTVYDFAKHLGLKVAVLNHIDGETRTFLYTKDSEVFTCTRCGETHLLDPYNTIFYENGVICDHCYDSLTYDIDYDGGEYDTGIRVKTVRFVYRKGDK